MTYREKMIIFRQALTKVIALQLETSVHVVVMRPVLFVKSQRAQYASSDV
jgi:hypothetical protein